MDQERGINKIHRVTNLDAKLVEYSDKEGKKQVRIVLMCQEGKTSYIFKDRLSDTSVISPSTTWFNKQLFEGVDEKGEDAQSV